LAREKFYLTNSVAGCQERPKPILLVTQICSGSAGPSGAFGRGYLHIVVIEIVENNENIHTTRVRTAPRRILCEQPFTGNVLDDTHALRIVCPVSDIERQLRRVKPLKSRTAVHDNLINFGNVHSM